MSLSYFCDKWVLPEPLSVPWTPSRDSPKIDLFFDLDFWSFFGANIGPKWIQIGSQNPSKIDPKSDWFFDWFLDAILITKWCQKSVQKASKIIQKSIHNRIWSEKRDFLKNSTSPTRELHFWGFRLPKTLPKLIKNVPISTPKSDWNFDRILIRFFIVFGSILAPKIDPKWV